MRIKNIQIDRFGVWRDLTLPLNEGGVTVFYGPNEAGKSTLMRFVRGTLYGFNPQGRTITRHGLSTHAKGALNVAHDGQEHLIAREADAGQTGRVRIDQCDWGSESEERIASLLSEVSESMFENVFAVGLSELQELATLDGEEVAQHIYGLSLGMDGERILRAHRSFEKERALVVSDDHKEGEAVELAQRIAEIDGLLADSNGASDRHRLLQSERRRLHAELERTEATRRTLEDNLRGYRFLGRVHGPWLRARSLRQERASLASSGACPPDALARYDALTREIDQTTRQRASLRRDAKRLLQAAGERSGDSTLLEHECSIRRLADERSDVRQRQRRLSENQARTAALKREADAQNVKLDERSSVARTSHRLAPAKSVGRVLSAAGVYQRAQSAKKRTVRRYQKLVASTKKREAVFSEQLKSLGGSSLDRAADALRDQLADVERFNELCRDEARLAGRLQGTGNRSLSGPQPRRLINYRDLPPLFYLVMWFFIMAGLTLFVLGLWGAATERVAAGTTAWIVGGIYACFGLCMAGVTWTVRQHFEQFFEGGLVGDGTFSFSGRTEPDTSHDPEIKRELSQIRAAIVDLVDRSTLLGLDTRDVERGELIDANLIRRISQRLTDLKELRQEQERIQQDRRRLSRYRDLLRDRQRDVGLRRRQWCELLRELGLEETLKVDQAVEQLEGAMAAEEIRREHANLIQEIERDQAAIDAHHGEFDRLRTLIPTEETDAASLSDEISGLVDHWLAAVSRAGGASEEQKRQRREGRGKRQEASRLEHSLRDLTSQRRQLLEQAGVSTREELEQAWQDQFRSGELDKQIEEADLEVQLIAEEEPELALVEENLLAFQAGDNKREVADAETELKQLDRDVQTASEELGRVKQELAELAEDRSTVSLRFEREQLVRKLKQSIERWAAFDLSLESIERIRHRLERHSQSESLQLASQYLNQLTAGRYRNIWSPLGERRLRVDDDSEQTLGVEQLSTGTREQVFLAIRLAMIRRLAQQGTELPLVLDDVFVNFDQARTEAAVETILDVAEAGQQVLLFTCHLHLADVFESKGVDAVWLPSNAVTEQKRKAG